MLTPRAGRPGSPWRGPARGAEWPPGAAERHARGGAVDPPGRPAGGGVRGGGSGAVLEAPALVSGLDDVAVVGQAIQERGGLFGVAEDARPFPEGQIGG